MTELKNKRRLETLTLAGEIAAEGAKRNVPTTAVVDTSYTCKGNMLRLGSLTYCSVHASRTSREKTLKLNLVDEGDRQVLRNEGLIVLRRRRIHRIANEAEQQGCRLSYHDLAVLLLTSLSTLKRDIAFLREHGLRVPLGTRRKRHRVSMETVNAG